MQTRLSAGVVSALSTMIAQDDASKREHPRKSTECYYEAVQHKL